MSPFSKVETGRGSYIHICTHPQDFFFKCTQLTFLNSFSIDSTRFRLLFFSFFKLIYNYAYIFSWCSEIPSIFKYFLAYSIHLHLFRSFTQSFSHSVCVYLDFRPHPHYLSFPSCAFSSHTPSPSIVSTWHDIQPISSNSNPSQPDSNKIFKNFRDF